MDALSLKQEIEETILKCLVESLSMISLSRAADISCPLVYASLVAGHRHMRAAQEILYLMHQNDWSTLELVTQKLSPSAELDLE